MLTLTPEDARTKILADDFPTEPTQISGDLDLSNQTQLTALPEYLRNAREINLSGCTSLTSLPANLDAAILILDDCAALNTLPSGLTLHALQAHRSGLQAIPEDAQISFKQDLTDCKQLKSLPNNLRVGSLILVGCSALQSLPDGLHIFFLDATNCTQLERWGTSGTVEIGKINLSGCRNLTYLPDWMTPVADLNVQGCENLRALPDSLVVTNQIDVADSGLKSLPAGCQQAELRWRDVRVDEQIAFHPEKLNAKKVLSEQNIELRRVMLERIGYDAFFRQVDAVELDQDMDPGGIRRLLKVEFEDRNRWQQDEPLVCLSVKCPSTARSYIIRVPPNTETCHQAAAWIAGFDDPSLYRPLIET